jgi:hypothetical protein
MKITNVKAMVAKVVTVGFLAAAFVVAAPKAEAQVRFGVQFGAPVYVAPRPVYVEPRPVYVEPRFGYGYDARFRHDEWVRHEAFDRYHHGPVYGYRR